MTEVSNEQYDDGLQPVDDNAEDIPEEGDAGVPDPVDEDVF